MSIAQLLSVLACVVVNTFGQVLLKLASKEFVDVSSLMSLIKAAFNIYLVGGILMYVIGMALWIWTLRITPLNMAYPLIGLCFITVPLMSCFVLGEPLSKNIVLGSVLIVSGAFFVAH
ncbi:MAG: EamA family transporter [Pseudomonadales bacterium]|nr:EamA family transporter [Pseudomonadales bacterium]